MIKDMNAVYRTQFLSGSSSVVHFSVISRQKSVVTLELPTWEASDLSEVTVSWGGTASLSTLRCECGDSTMAWQSFEPVDDTTLLCEVRVTSILVGLGEIWRSGPGETGSGCRLYRDWDCPGLRCSSLQTSWDKKEKFSHSSPMQIFSWLRSVRSFCLSQT